MNLTVTPKDLLDAGVHFGHQTKRWNPRSKPFVFDHRQGVTIIDLGKTHEALVKACNFLEELVANGGNVLFVGTKRQAREIVREAATSTSMPLCVDRWLGGTLTNYETVKRSIAKFKKYQAMETSGELSKLPRKEESAIKREMTRMQKNFSGIAEMGGLPSVMFVVDVNHHKIAVAEAARNVACAGALPIGATNCLNFGNPERPEIMWQFAEAVAGMGDACRALDVPITGGNVSLYNETDGQAVLPTPVVGVVGLLEHAEIGRAHV